MNQFSDNNILKGQNLAIKDIAEPLYVQSIDPNLMYGARLDIEYTMILKNESAIPATKVTVCNYLKDFSNSESKELSYDEDTYMITDSYKNKDYGWKIVNKTDSGNNKLFTPAVLNNLMNDYYIKCDYGSSDINALRQSPIGSGGERYLKVVLTKTLSSKDDGTEYSISGEIIEYSNDVAVRMRKKFPIETLLFADVIPGNGTESLNEKTTEFNGNQIGIVETDYAESNPVYILPPTGKERNYIYFVISIMSLIVILKIKGKKRKK